MEAPAGKKVVKLLKWISVYLMS